MVQESHRRQQPFCERKNISDFLTNKLAKARKTRTSLSTLGLKKFGLGKLWVKKFSGQKHFWVKKVFRVKNVFG